MVILDKSGKKIFDVQGVFKFEVVDDVFWDLFDLLFCFEFMELKQCIYNEFNSELVD